MNWLRNPFRTPSFNPFGTQPENDGKMAPPKIYTDTREPEVPRTNAQIQRSTNMGAMAMPESMRRTVEPQSRYDQIQEARDVYLKGTPGRKKSGLVGALVGGLQGLATGGLGGALGGAIGGGLGGLINPKGLRGAEFNAKVRPKIEERFAYEDQDRAGRASAAKAQQDAAFNAARISNMQSEDAYRQSEIEKNRQPKPPSYADSQLGIYNQQTGQIVTPAPPKPERVFAPEMKFGRSRKTGRTGWYDATNEAKAAEYDPLPEPRSFAPRAAPRAKEDVATMPISEVQKIAEQQGVSTDVVKARLAAKRIRVIQ